ncbi:hypothetical protein NMY22_g14307 [Coprinellus aureogranulatus]|nr:hypothetical protein NMY22_g14307 [Coprinellus aureogranulatus]
MQGVKIGSISHITELRSFWPKDVGDVKQAIEALLAHLSVTTLPSMRQGKTPDQETARRVLLIKTVLDVLEDTALGSVGNMSRENIGQILDVFEAHLTDLIAAMEFRARHSSAIFQGGNKERSARFGNILEANFIHRLIHLGVRHFEAREGRHTLAALVDCLLRCWVRGTTGTGSPQDTTLSPSDYTDISKILDALLRCVKEDAMTPLLVKRIASLDQRRLRLLAESFPYYCLEWSAVHAEAYRANPRGVNCDHLLAAISISQVFAEDVPSFHRALHKANFPSIALKIGCAFRRAPATGGCPGSVATDIASRLVPGSLSRAWAAVHVLPQLLDAGLLEVLIEDAITPGQRAMAKWSGQDPVHQICRVSHHPTIFKALDAAEHRLSEELRLRVDNHPAFDRLQQLPHAIETQEMLNERVDTIAQPLICSCLEHDTIGVKKLSKVYECSNCRTVAYCSRMCQERDWKVLHRDECAKNRVFRMECHLQGIWLSHLERARRLYALEVPLRHSLRTPPPAELSLHPAGQSAMQPIQVANMLVAPMGISVCASTEDFFTLRGSTTNTTPLFDDPRFRSMVQQAEGDTDVQLIGSVSMLGEYWIAALGAFHLGRPRKAPDGKELREMLHGHVRLFASTS